MTTPPPPAPGEPGEYPKPAITDDIWLPSLEFVTALERYNPHIYRLRQHFDALCVQDARFHEVEMQFGRPAAEALLGPHDEFKAHLFGVEEDLACSILALLN